MNIKTLSWAGAAVGLAIASLTLQTELSIKLDSLIVTEAEAADFADQHKIDRLRARMEVLWLKLQHADTANQAASIEAELALTQRQLNYILCIVDPRTDPDQCIP